MSDRNDYIVSFVDTPNVKRVADAIAPFTESDFRMRYYALKSDYEMPLSDEDFEYTWTCFTSLRELFNRAAAAGRSMLFSVGK